MKTFFDTSVLIAVFIGDHPHHEASARVFAETDKSHSFCALHSIAELYATVTRLPLKPMIAPHQAILLVQQVRNRLTLVALDETEYVTTIEKTAEQNIAGGRLYDALLIRCALKAEAETLYTWNLKHFQRLAPDLADKIKSPALL